MSEKPLLGYAAIGDALAEPAVARTMTALRLMEEVSRGDVLRDRVARSIYATLQLQFGTSASQERIDEATHFITQSVIQITQGHAIQRGAEEVTVAIFLHPPKDANTSKPDYEIDSPAILAWWTDKGIVGGSCLVPVRDLAAIIADEDHGGLGDVLWALEEASIVMVVRRETEPGSVTD